ncbi:MAG TPA: dTMP kinase [Cyanobacteria bacterium UBA9971]|nr:dTMP kinase [Cyanobacteria bacterium UBA9971]
MNKKGLFITFEGADGSGKSTQLKMAAEFFRNKGFEVVSTRDPGGTPLGQKIREILLHHDGKVASYCELFLYLADRAQHIDEKIIPALEEGKVVLCDRYVDSSLAYQGYARGIDTEEILMLNNIVAKSLMPDLTFVFDVSIEVAEQRVGETKDRLESEAKEFHQKVRFGFLDLAKKFPNRIKVIDANQEIEKVHSDVIKILGNY